jgi:hypothetical protein
LLKVNYSPLRVKKSRSHDMGHCLLSPTGPRSEHWGGVAQTASGQSENLNM